MRFKRKLIWVFCILAILFSCTKRPVIKTPQQSVDVLYESAMNDFEEKRYDQAIKSFSDVIFNYPGSRYAADAQYYLSLSYFEKKDYYQATIELEFFINNFAASPYIEPAIAHLALAYLRSAPSVQRDQTQMLKAQALIEEALDRFPDSKFRAEIEKAQAELLDRFASKDYKAAILYFRAREYEAAKIYFQHILDEYPQTSWAAKAKLSLATCYTETNAKEQARQILEELVNDDSNPEIQKKAQALLKKLN
jgi:outer membrane protein assembly factor BamD